MHRLPTSSSATPNGFCKARLSSLSPVSHWPTLLKSERVWPMSRGSRMLRTYLIRASSGGEGHTRLERGAAAPCLGEEQETAKTIKNATTETREIRQPLA